MLNALGYSSLSQSVVQGAWELSNALSRDQEVKTVFTIILKPYLPISHIFYKCTEFTDMVSDSTFQLTFNKL